MCTSQCSVCVPACLQGGQRIHLLPEDKIVCNLPGRTRSSESSLSCNGMVYHSIMFGIKISWGGGWGGGGGIIVKKPRADI